MAFLQGMHRLAPVALTALLATMNIAGASPALAGAPNPARAAACCMGWVYLGITPDTPLTPRMTVRVFGDDPDHHYDATVTPHLFVGRHQVARLPDFAVRDASPTPQRHILPVPRSVITRAARYGKRTGHRRAVLTFVLKQVLDRSTGTPIPNYAIDTYLRLPAVR